MLGQVAELLKGYAVMIGDLPGIAAHMRLATVNLKGRLRMASAIDFDTGDQTAQRTLALYQGLDVLQLLRKFDQVRRKDCTRSDCP